MLISYSNGIQASKKELTDIMSYGWARSEVLGGLSNACFLLALSLYVTLEAIPRFFTESAKLNMVDHVQPMLSAAETRKTSIIFIAVAGAGLLENLIGTAIFAGRVKGLF